MMAGPTFLRYFPSLLFLFLRLAFVNGECNGQSIISQAAPGATLSYKQTRVCETSPGVRSFSGYMHLPSSLLDGAGGAVSYNASMFFWYIESRKDPHKAPLALYLGGGPGTTSLGGVTAENGPCTINKDSNSTTHNPWSWNNHVNMLYIDQPTGVGYSFDQQVPSTVDLLMGTVSKINGPLDSAQTNATFVKGILPSQDPGAAANTTANAAKILWQFTQVWVQEFPEYNSSDSRLSIWTNSYGGHWGPGAMAYFESQNRQIHAGALTTSLRTVTALHLDTLGITNGCIDAKIEGQLYPKMAFNNTYGLQAITEEVYNAALANLTKPGGCNDLVDQCREVATTDSENTGANETINKACALAAQFCWEAVQGAYTATSGRSPFDISQPTLTVFPPEYLIGFFNQAWVQKELGALVNFTISSANLPRVYFGETGDPVRVTIDPINFVAQSGIKVALIFGDRDYRCNWLGGEAVSLSMQYPSASSFRAAGYASIATNSSYQGGVVRQHNGISFSRVFDAGHAVGAYQPETVSRIFDRVMFDRDVATGLTDTCGEGNASYSSTGPADSFHIKNVLPAQRENECYSLDPLNTCTAEQITSLQDGSAVVVDFVVRDR